MKKILIIIGFLVLVSIGVFYTTKSSKKAPDPELKAFKNSSLGISFAYPKIITASTTKESVILFHEVPFVHTDYCDFKGDGKNKINTLTDFKLSFHVSSKNIIETIKAESPYIPEENFVNGEIVPSPGFIDTYNNGTLKGFSIFEGAEGCGHTIYYLEVSDKKTLVVTNEFITVFSGAIDTEHMSEAMQVPGVINKEKAVQIFDSILKTVNVQ